jgi:23S rRNA (adenine-N6)-dimethyltransferase
VAVRGRPARAARGQHFLRSSRLAEELVRSAGFGPGDLVVDIGAGTGALTRALVESGARVLALELDPLLAAELRRRFRRAAVTVVEADAVEWRWPGEAFSVLANLPFAGSSAILGRLLQDPGRPLVRADVIVQWELAAKDAALWPATLRSTYWRAWHDLAVTRRLSRAAFAPVPRVDAAVLRVTRRREVVPAAEHERYWRFLTSAFGSNASLARALRPQLSPVELRRLADVLGFSVDARPRDLDADQWAGLYAHLRRRMARTRPRETASRRRAN